VCPGVLCGACHVVQHTQARTCRAVCRAPLLHVEKEE
jgi:hypothetical protein